MNPGLFVLGGGGDGGGSGAGDGKGGAGKQGAGGKNGGKGAPSDGRDGKACGKGASGGCAAHNPSVSAGDPIDPGTGDVFTETYTDFQLGGNLPLHLDRMYHTASRERDIGFGFGWTHTFGHELEVRRRTITLWKSDGSSMIFPALKVGEGAVARLGYKLERREWGYLLDCGDYRKRYLTDVGAPEGKLRVTAMENWNGQRDTITYQNGTIAQITDPCGRVIRFTHTNEARVAAIDLQDPITGHWVRTAEYLYDDAGNLVETTDVEGYRCRYRYDEDHRLTSYVQPGGLQFHYVYDDKGRCVETWGDYEDGRPEVALAAGLPDVLADGVTRAKGIYHTKVTFGDDGYSECVDSSVVKRLFSNAFGMLDKATTGSGVVSRTYDDLGFETSKTDASGATWITERDARGRPTKLVYPDGGVKVITRNEDGRPTEITDELGATTRYEYDARGNITRELDAVGGVTSYTYDDRGLLVRRVNPNGAARDFVYDRCSNLVEVRRANGGVWRYEYNGFGYRTAIVAPDGARTVLGINRRGDIQSFTDGNGATTSFDLDAKGRTKKVFAPDGGSSELLYGGVGWLHETKRATGESHKIRFNRDGMPVEYYNGKGEIHQFEYRPTGKIAKETTFDGRVYRYEHDGRGLLLRHEGDDGELLLFEYDEAGQTKKITDQEDKVIEYDWDAAGKLIGTRNDVSTVTLERNVMGEPVVERQALGAEEISVKTTYDKNGNVTATKSSLGFELSFELDAMCERTKVLLDGKVPVDFQFDLNPLEVARRLPGGAVLRSERDGEGVICKRVIEGPEGRPTAPAGQPQWIGRGPNAPREIAYRYSPTGELVGIDDTELGTTTLEYDLRGRLLSYEPPNRKRERFAYDANGNHLPENAHCVFGPGDRLLKQGDTEYSYDAGGRLIEKRVPRAGADADVWKYEWLSSGLLGKVTRPDGVRVELQYDALARRLEKRVTDPRAASVLRTRYVWNQEWLFQEITTSEEGGLSVPVSQRDYAFFGNSMAAMAHADVTFDDKGQVKDRTWYYYSNDPFGFPSELYDARGQLACRLYRDAFGKVEYAPGAKTDTPVRKVGQYFDPETGLHYNRWRYYDPEVGRFISPDPRGIHGAINAYTIGNNPIRWEDPYGLQTAESQRAAQLQAVGDPRGQDCVAVGRLDDGSTVITQNNNGSMPRPSQRDGSNWPGARAPGGNNPGAVTPGEFRQTQGIDPVPANDPRCNDAERRMIRWAESQNPPRRIESISSTNAACPSCRAALRAHNPNIVITDPNGQPAPNP